jgi:hypothetical protein
VKSARSLPRKSSELLKRLSVFFSFFSFFSLNFIKGVDRSPDLRAMGDAELINFIKGKMWSP